MKKNNKRKQKTTPNQHNATEQQDISPLVKNFQAIATSLPSFGAGAWLILSFPLYAFMLITGQLETSGVELILPSILKMFTGK